MTYREFNNLWLNSDSFMAKKRKAEDFNCDFIENLIYRPTTILEHCTETIDIHPEIVRNWDDEISELDKKYLSMKCSPKFIKSLNW